MRRLMRKYKPWSFQHRREATPKSGPMQWTHVKNTSHRKPQSRKFSTGHHQPITLTGSPVTCRPKRRGAAQSGLLVMSDMRTPGVKSPVERRDIPERREPSCRPQRNSRGKRIGGWIICCSRPNDRRLGLSVACRGGLHDGNHQRATAIHDQPA